MCVDVEDIGGGGHWSTTPGAPAAAAGDVSVHLPYLLASRQRQLITVAALTAAMLFIYDGLQVSLISSVRHAARHHHTAVIAEHCWMSAVERTARVIKDVEEIF